MALDGIFLHMLAREISATALGARVDKIQQPAREELVFTLRTGSGSQRLLLSAAAAAPRIHFTQTRADNPKTAPMLCMLLRKHLTGAKLVAIEQEGLDRILRLVFDAKNELAEPVRLTVAVEIMGRHSNIILYGKDGRIIAPVKRVGPQESGVRQVLPGLQYTLPPAQSKLNLLEAGARAVAGAVLESPRELPLSKLLLEKMQGASPVLCREIAHYAARGADPVKSQIDGEQRTRLLFYLSSLEKTLQTGGAEPTAALEANGRLIDFSCIPLTQYGSGAITRSFDTLSELLDFCYGRKGEDERTRQRAGDLLKLLVNLSERTVRKIATQRQELLECENREELRIKAELLSASLHLADKGAAFIDAPNYYDETGAAMRIELDPALSAAQNAQSYYKRYRKAQNAQKLLHGLIAQGEQQLAYLDSVFDLLSRATTQDEIDAIRQELSNTGFLRTAKTSKGKNPAKLQPVKYLSSDGFTILAGRNNLQNDVLSLKTAQKSDLWLHTQRIHGSHVILCTQGKEPPRQTLEEAARIAAWHSRARDSSSVPVDYTPVKNLRKSAGAKPGFVIYDSYKTLYVIPSEDEIQALLSK